MNNRNTSHDKRKGKGKASKPPEESPEHESLANRVAKSAAALAQGLVNSRPAGDDISRLGSSEKGHQGSSSSERWPTGSASHQQGAPSVPNTAQDVFRTSQVDRHTVEEERAFSDFLDTQVPVAGSTGSTESSFLSSQATLSTPAPRRPVVGAASSVAEQERNDGAEVLNLLSQPDTQPPDLEEDVELSDESIASLKEALFRGGSTTASPQSRQWDQLLNFIPDFVRPDASQAGTAPAHNQQKSLETKSAMGVDHSPEVAEIWVEQWHDVLTAYTDEVWGDLTPLVRQARKEVEQLEEARPSDPPPDTRALQRLRLILGHIRT